MLETSTYGPGLAAGAPWASRIKAWVDERFPLGQVVLFLLLYATTWIYGRTLIDPGQLQLTLRQVFGFLAFWSFFLLLRVCDEHKDFESDRRNHPQRVLQRGLIHLRDLRMIAVGCVGLQAAVAVGMDGGSGPVTRWWLLVMVWTALMTVEFFAGEWLRARLFLYAVSHMLVMPLALLWVLAMAGEGTTGLPTWKALWLAALGFFFGFVFEVARKLRAPDDEREGIDSYSKVFGPSGAAGVLGFLLTLSMVSIGGLLHAATGSLELWWGLILAALAGLGWFAVVRFHRQPRRESAERLEKTVMLAGLSAFVVCDLILILERGVAWSV